MQSDLYNILGVNHNASLKEIKAAYRALAKQYHPDVSTEINAEAKFIAITEAYEILSDPNKRKRYDLTKSSSGSRNTNRRYEASTNRAREAARKKAHKYKDMDYKRFESEYFSSFGAFFIPKFLGCLGMGIISLIILIIILMLIIKYELSIFYLFIAVIILFFTTSYFSVSLNMRHDAKAKKRYKNKKPD